MLNEIFLPLAEEFAPEIILMIDGADPHYSDSITRMGLTLNGIWRIGDLIGRTADKVCNGKIVDFIGSGYNPNPDVISLGWLASEAGVIGVSPDFIKLQAESDKYSGDQGMDEAKKVVDQIKKQLSGDWKF